MSFKPVLDKPLLPNTTSKIHPLDASIISGVKNKYRRRLLFHIFDCHESDRMATCAVDILTAMCWAVTAWEKWPREAIKNSFNSCLVQDAVDAAKVSAFGDVDETRMEMELDATEPGIAFTSAWADAFFRPTEKSGMVESFIIRELRWYSAVVMRVILEKPEENESEWDKAPYTVEEKLKGLADSSGCL